MILVKRFQLLIDLLAILSQPDYGQFSLKYTGTMTPKLVFSETTDFASVIPHMRCLMLRPRYPN